MRLSTQHQEHSQHWEKDQRKGSWPGCKVRPSTFLWGAPPGTLHNTDRSIYVGVSGPLRQHACALLKVASENYRSTQMKTAAMLLTKARSAAPVRAGLSSDYRDKASFLRDLPTLACGQASSVLRGTDLWQALLQTRGHLHFKSRVCAFISCSFTGAAEQWRWTAT